MDSAHQKKIEVHRHNRTLIKFIARYNKTNTQLIKVPNYLFLSTVVDNESQYTKLQLNDAQHSGRLLCEFMGRPSQKTFICMIQDNHL